MLLHLKLLFVLHQVLVPHQCSGGTYFWSAHWEIQWGKKALGQRLRGFVYKNLAYCIVDSERCFRTFLLLWALQARHETPGQTERPHLVLQHPIKSFPTFLVALLLFSIGIIFTNFFFNGKTLLKRRGLVHLKISVARTATTRLLAKQFSGYSNKQDDFKRKIPPWKSLS
jgi:hypothetical protein